MKNLLLSFLTLAILASCNQKPKTKLAATENIKGLVYGDSVKNDNVIDLTSLSTALGDDTKLDLKVKGKVNDVFPTKHCWMTMKLSSGEDMIIRFTDSTLMIPKTLKGKEVILDGFAYSDTLSIEEQKEFAKDEGKVPEEVAKITTPKVSLQFKAKGLVVL